MEFSELSDYIINGRAPAAEEWTQAALDEGNEALTIVNQGLVPGMDVVGERFKNGEYYLPEVLLSARAMKRAMALLSPLLARTEGASLGRVVMGTVKGDLHDIGKNLVGMMLEGAGFEVINLGTDVTPEQFLKAVEEDGAQLVCMSALLTTTMPVMKAVVDLLEESEVRQQVQVMVGGAPVTERYASDIGADGYAPEAASAVQTAKDLMGVEAS
ncbi:MAG: corrinoid protein [SAR202 cluster bacterium]|jgi:5-methyltetrahydrofolate--homocysteine methyltransferase|nr:corrinoid protein [SAR202 cluster bacterium]MDP6511945.1 corrinoid protein [SAR202 cluster bacterium]MDP6713126.1 corrinoid protein [SAR202 cluster bacterium]